MKSDTQQSRNRSPQTLNWADSKNRKMVREKESRTHTQVKGEDGGDRRNKNKKITQDWGS